MQNDGKTANYIGEAVILLTADHLGIETEMLDIAKQVWHTKRLPDAPLLGHYASAGGTRRRARPASRPPRTGALHDRRVSRALPDRTVQGLSDDLCTARCVGCLYERRHFLPLGYPRTLRSASLVRTGGRLLPRKRHRRE